MTHRRYLLWVVGGAFSVCAYLLTVTCAAVLQRSCDVENPSTSKCSAIAGSDGWDSTCNGFRVDGEWKHQ